MLRTRSDASPKHHISYNIHNIITTADLQQKIDVPRFIYYSWGMYDTELYGGRCGYVKDQKMPGRVTVFLSGKLISTGANTVETSILQLEQTMNILSRNGFSRNVRLETHVRNIVATSDLGRRIDLNKASMALSKANYDPDEFPAMIVRSQNGPTLSIFASGKIIVTGAKSEKEISSALIDIQKRLENYLL